MSGLESLLVIGKPKKAKTTKKQRKVVKKVVEKRIIKKSTIPKKEKVIQPFKGIKVVENKTDSWVRLQNDILKKQIKELTIAMNNYQEPNTENNKYLAVVDKRIAETFMRLSDLELKGMLFNDYVEDKLINIDSLNYSSIMEVLKTPENEIEKELNEYLFKNKGTFKKVNNARYRRIFFLTIELIKFSHFKSQETNKTDNLP